MSKISRTWLLIIVVITLVIIAAVAYALVSQYLLVKITGRVVPSSNIIEVKPLKINIGDIEAGKPYEGKFKGSHAIKVYKTVYVDLDWDCENCEKAFYSIFVTVNITDAYTGETKCRFDFGFVTISGSCKLEPGVYDVVVKIDAHPKDVASPQDFEIKIYIKPSQYQPLT